MVYYLLDPKLPLGNPTFRPSSAWAPQFLISFMMAGRARPTLTHQYQGLWRAMHPPFPAAGQCLAPLLYQKTEN
jgi:hypothetical protein